MLTIALDEQGDFENLQNKLNTEPVFIGGVMYEDEGDYDEEKLRLRNYLKRVCEASGGEYPKDLHFSGTKDNNNSAKVREFKQEFARTIGEFFKEGTVYGTTLHDTKRQGRYRIFAILRGENGKTDLLDKSVSEAVREDFAGNLYLHMAEDLVERLIFHNPVIDRIDKVKLELATRRVILTGDDRVARKQEYEKLGYQLVVREDRGGDGRAPGGEKAFEFKLTDPSNYRTTIEREMLKTDNKAIMIDRIGVKSIDYKYGGDRMEFLYLADAICSYLSFERKGNTPAEWIGSFLKSAEEVCTGSIIWGYDEADEYFDKALKAIEGGRYHEAICDAYDGIHCKSAMASFYKNHCYGGLSHYADKRKTAEIVTRAIKEFKNSIFSNSVNQEKLVFEFEILKRLAESVVFANRKLNAVMYDLYDAGISAYSHIGDTGRAEACFNKTLEYAEYVTTEEFLRTRNRMIVFLCDKFEFGKACMYADQNVRCHEKLVELKKELFDNPEYESLNHAIALSQRAQVYAFTGSDKAETDFESALAIMDEKTPDRLITMSYYMHYLIMEGKKELYEKYAEEYFGEANDLSAQFESVVKDGVYHVVKAYPDSDHGVAIPPRFSLKFALFVYVKALFYFYLDEIPKELLLQLKDVKASMIKLVPEVKTQLNGHPWEIINKYLSLIMYHYDDKENGDRYRKAIEEFISDDGGLISDIARTGIRICEAAASGAKPETDRASYMYG